METQFVELCGYKPIKLYNYIFMLKEISVKDLKN